MMPDFICQMPRNHLLALRGPALEIDLTSAEFQHIFRTFDGLWLHSGNPKDPHVELTAGGCSNGFVNVLQVIRYPNLCRLMAWQLVRQLRRNYERPVHVVVGSDHASATLSYEVASLLGAWHDFTEKGENHTQVWKRFGIEPHETVLQVEDLVTTTRTLSDVRRGIRRGNQKPVDFAPVVLTLVHRSSAVSFEGSPIIFLQHYDIESWEPSVCPLCAQGSKRVRAKEHWAELTGRA